MLHKITGSFNLRRLVRLLALLIPVILFVSHLPFLSADPDINISYSRDAFTDEGLNTIQIRNYINHHDLSVTECDNLLKTPFFAIILSLPFFIFGTDLEVARMTVLLFVMTSMIFLLKDRYFKGIILILIPLTMLQYEVFQYSHYALAEMVAVITILLGIYLYFKACLNPQLNSRFILAALIVSFAYFFKIQFLYIVPLLPLAFLVHSLAHSRNVQSFTKFGVLILFTTGAGLAYLFFWYLPFRETYNYMLSNQSGFFEISNKSLEYIDFNFRYYFIDDPYLLHLLTFCLLLIISIFIYRRSSKEYKILYPVALVWILLELHKMVMVYLPTRYLISLYFAVGFFMAIVLRELFMKIHEHSLSRKIKITLAGIILLTVTISNLTDYFKVLHRRTYEIKNANTYLAEGYRGDGPVLGAWAPSLTWESDAKAMPVWDAFLNYQEPVANFLPEIVVSEKDEEDSNQAWQKQNLDLTRVSDSSRSFTIGNWDVVVYWIKYH